MREAQSARARREIAEVWRVLEGGWANQCDGNMDVESSNGAEEKPRAFAYASIDGDEYAMLMVEYGMIRERLLEGGDVRGWEQMMGVVRANLDRRRS